MLPVKSLIGVVRRLRGQAAAFTGHKPGEETLESLRSWMDRHGISNPFESRPFDSVDEAIEWVRSYPAFKDARMGDAKKRSWADGTVGFEVQVHEDGTARASRTVYAGELETS